MLRTFLGRILRQLGCLEDQDILLVLAAQRRLRVRFGDCARELGLVSDDQLSFALGIQCFDDQKAPPLEEMAIEPAVLARIGESVARRCEVLPLMVYNDTLIVAVADPFDNRYLQSLPPEARSHVGFVVVHREELLNAIQEQYSAVHARNP